MLFAMCIRGGKTGGAGRMGPWGTDASSHVVESLLNVVSPQVSVLAPRHIWHADCCPLRASMPARQRGLFGRRISQPAHMHIVHSCFNLPAPADMGAGACVLCQQMLLHRCRCLHGLPADACRGHLQCPHAAAGHLPPPSRSARPGGAAQARQPALPCVCDCIMA